MIKMSQINLINFPCEGIVLNYKPFADEPARNLNLWIESKEQALIVLDRYSNYTILFGISISISDIDVGDIE